MKKTGLRVVAASMDRDRRFPRVGVGDLTRSAFPPLGLRVSCGEQFRMGVDVCEALKRASMHGIQKVDFSEEVCELEAPSVKTGLDVGEVGMIDEDMPGNAALCMARPRIRSRVWPQGLQESERWSSLVSMV